MKSSAAQLGKVEMADDAVFVASPPCLCSLARFQRVIWKVRNHSGTYTTIPYACNQL